MNKLVEDISLFMQPTFFIDSDHESIVKLASNLTRASDPPEIRAEQLFIYVRDEIEYNFPNPLEKENYIASKILARGKGYCITKAVLLCALARAAQIPTAIIHSDLLDHTLPPHVQELMGTNIMYFHAFNSFLLGGKWIRADASQSYELIKRKGYHLVEFDPTKDSLLPETMPDGRPHAEYLKIYGTYSDFPFDGLFKIFTTKLEQMNFDDERIKRILDQWG